MKSLNVKKIATAAAGAALLGAAFAGAVSVDTSGLENFNFFASGSPQVKLVVGEKAAPSDAVAAANIAAMIGNMAYTAEDITVIGTDLLSCEGGTTSTTTASADDKVKLEITTPGVNPNVAYQLKTYIEGYLDANATDDRADAMAGSMTILSTSTPYASAGRKVTSTETPLAFKGTITDSQVSRSYTEEERYYLYARSQYDTSSKKVKAKSPQLAYEAQFTNPIQVCTELTPDDNSCSDTYKSVKHRMKVKLFGVDWVIYGMDNFPTDGSMNTSAVATLGKEVQYKEFMQIGDEVTAPNGIKVKLKDISAVPTTAQQLLSASFEVYDKDDKLLDAQTLQQDGEYNKNNIVIRVFSVFAGLGQTSYAQVSIFSDKLALQHGSVVNTDNQNWRVNLVGGGSSYGSSLARIQLNRQVINDMVAGDSIAFIQKPELLKMTYTGLADISYDTLTFGTGERNFPTSTTDTSTTGLSYLSLTSGLTSPFNFGTTSTNVLYYITDATGAGNGSIGTIFYQNPTTGLFVPYWHSAGNGSIDFANATAGFSFSSATYATVSNYSAQCDTFGALAANATLLTANASYARSGLTLGNQTQFGPANVTGVVTSAGYSISSMGTTVASLAVLASTVNSGCDEGYFVYSFPTTWTGILYPAEGTTGVTTNATTNYAEYNYGPNTVNIRFASGGISQSTTDPTGAYTVFIPEYQKTDDTDAGAFALDIGYGDQTTPRLTASSGKATGGYIGGSAADYGLTNTSATAYEAGFISPRGSKLDAIGLNSATVKYATTLASALYTLSSAGVDTTSNKAETEFKTGEMALDSNGYKVKVVEITAKGTGSATTGGEVSGIDNLAPSLDSAYNLVKLDTAASPIVVTDAEASETQPLIVVGGPLVNSVAKQALAGSPAPTASMEPVVKVQGDKILVYGYTAADTQSAADELISWLAANADAVTGR
ncbi:S-layer protein [Candidatus Micrarchaeota archaeon]|nr:S-layer protein [Candidatus Micrarchaeota archaeon]